MIVNARFIGQNGSMGYRRGAKYNITVHTARRGLFGERVSILVHRHQLPKKGGVIASFGCPYESVESFLSNWTEVRVLKK